MRLRIVEKPNQNARLRVRHGEGAAMVARSGWVQIAAAPVTSEAITPPTGRRDSALDRSLSCSSRPRCRLSEWQRPDCGSGGFPTGVPYGPGPCVVRQRIGAQKVGQRQLLPRDVVSTPPIVAPLLNLKRRPQSAARNLRFWGYRRWAESGDKPGSVSASSPQAFRILRHLMTPSD